MRPPRRYSPRGPFRNAIRPSTFLPRTRIAFHFGPAISGSSSVAGDDRDQHEQRDAEVNPEPVRVVKSVLEARGERRDDDDGDDRYASDGEYGFHCCGLLVSLLVIRQPRQNVELPPASCRVKRFHFESLFDLHKVDMEPGAYSLAGLFAPAPRRYRDLSKIPHFRAKVVSSKFLISARAAQAAGTTVNRALARFPLPPECPP